jgi:hypothetical protein
MREVRVRGGGIVEQLDEGERTAMPMVSRSGRAEQGAHWQEVPCAGILVRVPTGHTALFIANEALAQLGYRRVETTGAVPPVVRGSDVTAASTIEVPLTVPGLSEG